MSEDIRVGDRFLVEVEVTALPHGEWPRVTAPAGPTSRYYTTIGPDVLRAAKRIPRAIKVGDRVRTTNDGWRGVAEVIAVQGEFAWLRDSGLPAGEPWTRPLDVLILVGEASS